MKSFGEVITWTPEEPGTWAGTVSPEWMQGRTSFGGVAAAVGLRALRAVVDDDRPPRAVHTSFFGPLGPEPARVQARVIRSGRSATHARAEIHQGQGMPAQVIGVFAADRRSSITVDPPAPPARPDPETLVDMPYVAGVAPAFVQHFSLRWTEGAMPFSGGTEPRLGGYCRHRTDPGPSPYEAILGLADAWPSPLVTLMRSPAPASSVTWTATFVDVPATIEPDAWWWYGSEAIAARHGYAGMRASLYAPDGRLALMIEQLVAVFDKPPG